MIPSTSRRLRPAVLHHFGTLRSLTSNSSSQTYENKADYGNSTSNERFNQGSALAAVGVVGVGSLCWWKWGRKTAQMKSPPLKLKGGEEVETSKRRPPVQLVHSPQAKYIAPARPDLPIFTRKEVMERKGSGSDRIWVTYSNGVYDITDFVNSHPGGRDKILLAAGGGLEPFWKMYAQHKTPEVAMILEELRIGTLDPKEVLLASSKRDDDDPFANEPERHPALIVNSATPFNAESPPSLLNDTFLTEQDIFYVRNHLPVPKTNVDTHRLVVEGGLSRLELSVNELKRRFETVDVTAAIQCAGNRRRSMSESKEVKGLSWAYTAIGNAQWTGVRLKDVLESCGANLEKYKHVICKGADKDMTETHYETSIPLTKALHPDTILAFEMNGEPLSRDHGYPIRLVAPGIVGARQVKWLSGIALSQEESGSHWQQRDYRAFNSAADPAAPDYSQVPSIQEGPVQSAICSPLPHADVSIDEETVEVKGYAWSGGGRGIVRVEVSVDGGNTWQTASLTQDPKQDLDQMWAWTQWETQVPIPKFATPGETIEIVCKATDRSYNTQPETVKGIWNFRGLLNNSWHRIPVKITE